MCLHLRHPWLVPSFVWTCVFIFVIPGLSCHLCEHVSSSLSSLACPVICVNMCLHLCHPWLVPSFVWTCVFIFVIPGLSRHLCEHVSSSLSSLACPVICVNMCLHLCHPWLVPSFVWTCVFIFVIPGLSRHLCEHVSSSLSSLACPFICVNMCLHLCHPWLVPSFVWTCVFIFVIPGLSRHFCEHVYIIWISWPCFGFLENLDILCLIGRSVESILRRAIAGNCWRVCHAIRDRIDLPSHDVSICTKTHFRSGHPLWSSVFVTKFVMEALVVKRYWMQSMYGCFYLRSSFFAWLSIHCIALTTRLSVARSNHWATARCFFPENQTPPHPHLRYVTLEWPLTHNS